MSDGATPGCVAIGWETVGCTTAWLMGSCPYATQATKNKENTRVVSFMRNPFGQGYLGTLFLYTGFQGPRKT